MIKATTVAGDGVPILMLGLSRHNLDRLREGDGMPIEAAALGLDPLHIFIFAGETEEAIQAQFAAGGVELGRVDDLKSPYDELRGAVGALVEAVGTDPLPRHLQPAYDRVLAAWTLGSD